MNACKFDDPSHELWEGTSRGHVLPDFFIVRSEWLPQNFVWQCFRIMNFDLYFKLVTDISIIHPDQFLFVLEKWRFWTSLNLDILELDQDSRPWRVIILMWVSLRSNPPPRWHVLFKGPHITTGHWLEVPNMTSPNLWTLEMTPEFWAKPLLYAADLHGDSDVQYSILVVLSCHPLYIVTVQVCHWNEEFGAVGVSLFPLKLWRTIWIWISKKFVLQNIVDVVEFLYHLAYIYTYTHRKGRKQWDSCQLALDISHQQWYLVLADPLVLFNFYALKM